jgi:hypothetical protein
MTTHPRPRRSIVPLLSVALLCPSLLSTAGCTALGVAAAKLGPPPKVAAAYKDLAGRSVGIMVWADRGLRIDYQGIQIDVARGIQNKLQLAQSEAKRKELKETSFPVKPESIYNYQRQYPQMEAMQLVDVAPKMGVQRLIYVEITDFSTRPEPSIELFRGSIGGTVKVIEIGPDKKAKVVFTDNDVRAVFPKSAPQDGVPNAGDFRIYRGTTDAFTTEVVHRFVEYEVEE